MAVLTAKQKNNFKKSTFGLPAERKYPINDRRHAINAKARATQMVNEGKLSRSEEKMIDRKANALLHKGKHKKIEKHAEKASMHETHHSGKVTKHKHIHEHVHHHVHKEKKGKGY